MRSKSKLAKAYNEMTRLWRLMCIEEGVGTNSKFVVFRPTNKFAAEYNEAVKHYFRLRTRSSRVKLDAFETARQEVR